MAGPQGTRVSRAVLATTPLCAGWGRLLCQALIVVRKWYRDAVSHSLVLESTILSRSVSRPDQTTVLAPQYHLPGWQGSIPGPNRTLSKETTSWGPAGCPVRGFEMAELPLPPHPTNVIDHISESALYKAPCQ